jgi:hypothetical protein
VRIEQLVQAETGWKAVFKEPDASETLSRILGWAVLSDEEGQLVGMIVDPGEPSRIIPAVGASSPGGGTFLRYRYVAPDPLAVTVSVPPPAAEKEKDEEDPTTQIAKSLLKRRR